MATTTKKQEINNQKTTKKQEVKKLSKVGEWLRSGQSMGKIVDMRAVLK
jgi:hypothetical protein